MANDFRTVLVKDSTIADITPDLDFCVKSGASSTTYQPFRSTTQSNSSLIFNVQVPSENIVMGRDVLVRASLAFNVVNYIRTAAGDVDGAPAVGEAGLP